MSSPSIRRLPSYETLEMNRPCPDGSYEARRQESRSYSPSEAWLRIPCTVFPLLGHMNEKTAATLARCGGDLLVNV